MAIDHQQLAVSYHPPAIGHRPASQLQTKKCVAGLYVRPKPRTVAPKSGSLGGFPAGHPVDEQIRLGLRRIWVAPRVGLDPTTDLSAASRNSDVLHQTVLHLLTTSDTWR